MDYVEEEYDGQGPIASEEYSAEPDAPQFYQNDGALFDDFGPDEEEDEDSEESHMYEGQTFFRYKFPDGYIRELREAWYECITGTKYANHDTLGAVLRQLGLSPTYADLKTYMMAYDRETRGKQVTFSSMCDIMKSYMQDNPSEVFERALVQAFRIFDNELEGYVNTNVIRDMLLMLPEIEEPKDIEKLLRELDENNEGYISYESFVSNLCELFKEGLEQEPGLEVAVYNAAAVKAFLDEAGEKADDGADPSGVEKVLSEAKALRERRKRRMRRRRRRARKSAGLDPIGGEDEDEDEEEGHEGDGEAEKPDETETPVAAEEPVKVEKDRAQVIENLRRRELEDEDYEYQPDQAVQEVQEEPEEEPKKTEEVVEEQPQTIVKKKVIRKKLKKNKK